MDEQQIPYHKIGKEKVMRMNLKPGEFISFKKDMSQERRTLGKVIRFDNAFKKYKIKNLEGEEFWCSYNQLRIVDEDPILLKTYDIVLAHREQLESLQKQLDAYKRRSFFTRLKEFFTGSK